MGSLGTQRGRDPSYVINIHNDAVGGSKYNENSTDGSSAGHFGNIGEAPSRNPAPGFIFSILLLTSPTEQCDGNVPYGYTRFQNISNSRVHESMPSESQHDEFHPDEGTKGTSATYLKPSYAASSSMSPSHSCSLSPSPSRSSQHAQIFSSILDKEFIRRNTASWFEQGKMFEISNCNQNTMIAGSSMIVVGRKRSSIVCLRLIRHPGIKGNERPFFKARVPIYAKGKPTPSYLAALPCEPLKIALEDGRELSNDVWINVNEPQTIRLDEVEVALHGNMCEDDFKKLRGAYLNAQESITGRHNQKRPNAFVLHAEIFWTSITRGAVWLGQRIRTGWRAED